MLGAEAGPHGIKCHPTRSNAPLTIQGTICDHVWKHAAALEVTSCSRRLTFLMTAQYKTR